MPAAAPTRGVIVCREEERAVADHGNAAAAQNEGAAFIINSIAHFLWKTYGGKGSSQPLRKGEMCENCEENRRNIVKFRPSW